MRYRIFAFVSPLVFGLLALTALADTDGGTDADIATLTTWYGIVEYGYSPQGILQECDEPGAFGFYTVTHRHAFSSLIGVCDDLSGRPCNGRVTAIFEQCADRQIPYVNDSQVPPLATTFWSIGPVRICYNEDPDVARACAEENEVARGIVKVQIPLGMYINEMNSAGFDQTNTTRDEEIITDSRWFMLDGTKVRVRRGPSIGGAENRTTFDCFTANDCPASGWFVPFGGSDDGKPDRD